MQGQAGRGDDDRAVRDDRGHDATAPLLVRLLSLGVVRAAAA